MLTSLCHWDLQLRLPFDRIRLSIHWRFTSMSLRTISNNGEMNRLWTRLWPWRWPSGMTSWVDRQSVERGLEMKWFEFSTNNEKVTVVLVCTRHGMDMGPWLGTWITYPHSNGIPLQISSQVKWRIIRVWFNLVEFITYSHCMSFQRVKVGKAFELYSESSFCISSSKVRVIAPKIKRFFLSFK